eukprot:SAG22_NODE_89_length_21278_cov_16.698758_8_plen_1027_part_00
MHTDQRMYAARARSACQALKTGACGRRRLQMQVRCVKLSDHVCVVPPRLSKEKETLQVNTVGSRSMRSVLHMSHLVFADLVAPFSFAACGYEAVHTWVDDASSCTSDTYLGVPGSRSDWFSFVPVAPDVVHEVQLRSNSPTGTVTLSTNIFDNRGEIIETGTPSLHEIDGSVVLRWNATQHRDAVFVRVEASGPFSMAIAAPPLYHVTSVERAETGWPAGRVSESLQIQTGGFQRVDLPFSFPYMGLMYRQAFVASAGFVTFGQAPPTTDHFAGVGNIGSSIIACGGQFNLSAVDAQVAAARDATSITITWGAPLFSSTEFSHVALLLRANGSVEISWGVVDLSGGSLAAGLLCFFNPTSTDENETDTIVDASGNSMTGQVAGRVVSPAPVVRMDTTRYFPSTAILSFQSLNERSNETVDDGVATRSYVGCFLSNSGISGNRDSIMGISSDIQPARLEVCQQRCAGYEYFAVRKTQWQDHLQCCCDSDGPTLNMHVDGFCDNPCYDSPSESCGDALGYHLSVYRVHKSDSDDLDSAVVCDGGSSCAVVHNTTGRSFIAVTSQPGRTYGRARRYCQTHYEDIASIRNLDELEMIRSLCSRMNTTQGVCNIGLTARNTVQGWLWSDGSSVDSSMLYAVPTIATTTEDTRWAGIAVGPTATDGQRRLMRSSSSNEPADTIVCMDSASYARQIPDNSWVRLPAMKLGRDVSVSAWVHDRFHSKLALFQSQESLACGDSDGCRQAVGGRLDQHGWFAVGHDVPPPGTNSEFSDLFVAGTSFSAETTAEFWKRERWVLVTVVVSGRKVSVYADGALRGVGLREAPLPVMMRHENYIGAPLGGVSFRSEPPVYSGMEFGDFRLFNRDLLAAEVASIHADITADCCVSAGLRSVFESGDNVIDLSPSGVVPSSSGAVINPGRLPEFSDAGQSGPTTQACGGESSENVDGRSMLLSDIASPLEVGITASSLAPSDQRGVCFDGVLLPVQCCASADNDCANSRVTGLALAKSMLRGSVPVAIGRLGALRALKLHDK